MWGASLIELVIEHQELLSHGLRPEPKAYSLSVHGRILSEAFLRMFDERKLSRFVVASGPAAADSREFKADVVQALISVAYLAGGIDAVKNFYNNNLAVIFEDLQTKAAHNDDTNIAQEVAVKMGFGEPKYRVKRDPLSPEHSPIFLCECILGNQHFAEGRGPTKKDARGDAARKLLQKLKLPGNRPPN
jgi:dsRNA-specific ribonuclease